MEWITEGRTKSFTFWPHFLLTLTLLPDYGIQAVEWLVLTINIQLDTKKSNNWAREMLKNLQVIKEKH